MDDYLQRLKERLVDQYQHVKQHRSQDPLQESAIKGYMEAGLVTGIANADMLKAVMNQAYKKVFGTTYEERNKSASKTNDAYENMQKWIQRRVH
ncbi:hypothetical protein [Thiomicrospira sp. WB1]|uniref:hypothetical protein n=1 Tax=Thiomicrospira sp. WB1 TaxID=1685380 RepID=UPI000AF7616E|nr:hypothetical protein [Thiomicrospira sp. WB1]